MDPSYISLTYIFLQIRSQIKLYHWNTLRYSRHKATDKFLQTFEPLVDRFVEAAQGAAVAEGRSSVKKKNKMMDSPEQWNWQVENAVTDDNAINFLAKFRAYLTNLDISQSELAQIRDDILEITDITLYLFTLQ